MKILIIEDDQMVRKALSHHLLESGHTLVTASNGQEAANIISQNRNIDLVICDVMMPVLTGPSFLLMLQNMYPERRPGIIIISGAKIGADYLKKIEIPFDHFLRKPVQPEQLDEAIMQLQSAAAG